MGLPNMHLFSGMGFRQIRSTGLSTESLSLLQHWIRSVISFIVLCLIYWNMCRRKIYRQGNNLVTGDMPCLFSIRFLIRFLIQRISGYPLIDIRLPILWLGKWTFHFPDTPMDWASPQCRTNVQEVWQILSICYPCPFSFLSMFCFAPGLLLRGDGKRYRRSITRDTKINGFRVQNKYQCLSDFLTFSAKNFLENIR